MLIFIALQLLQNSPAPDVRTSAASTLTKLALKAKALQANSAETTEALNIAFSVLKNAVSQLQDTSQTNPKAASKVSTPVADAITTVSFSSLDDTAKGKVDHHTGNNGVFGQKKSILSVERAVEVFAALAGKSDVKEELVHGSSRYGKICIID
jgi:hypothetical protein